MSRVYQFGAFRLEVDERRLTRDGCPVVLKGKAFDMLVALADDAGRLLSYDMLLDRLWPGVVVDHNNLAQNVSLVRKALGSEHGAQIETVPRQGYRFLAEVVVENEPRVARAASPGSQRIELCRARDGARLAYARHGQGPPIVKVAHWLSHLELDRGSLWWRHWLALLGRGRTVFRYDARGNGLSDARPPAITFESFVADLGDVMDAANIGRAPLVGISQGAAVATAFAARHPERVSALVLIGGCARGWRAKGHPKVTAHFEALMTLMKNGWGRDNAAFRHIFTSAFFPDADKLHQDAFNELQKQTATPENAALILSALGDLDVRSALEAVRVPTVVFHSRGDAVVPLSDGMELAAGIRGARFESVDSRNHLLLESEPAWSHLADEIERFLAEL